LANLAPFWQIHIFLKQVIKSEDDFAQVKWQLKSLIREGIKRTHGPNEEASNFNF
jgi:hypothetical protein